MAKRRKAMTAQAKNRLIVFGPICLLLIGYFAFTVLSYTATLYQLKKEKAELEQTYQELQKHADELKIEINKLHDPDYIAKYARENYLYSKEGELIIKINESQEEVATKEKKLEINKDVLLVSFAVLFFIFLYILLHDKKKKKSA